MSQIRFISTSTIKHDINHNELSRRIELTPWDLTLILMDYIQKGILFHKPKCTKESINSGGNELIQHLKFTLSRTLNIFYPLAGRLVMIENEDKTTSFYLDCNNQGAQFIHAVNDDIKISDILNPIHNIFPDELVYSLFSMNKVLNYEGTYKPLLSVQITELIDGLFIACTMNHSVADGTFFWHFFNTWSSISRDLGFSIDPTQIDPLQFQPVIDRGYLDGIIDLPIRIPFFQNQIQDKFISPLPLQQKMFHFCNEKIALLKAKANNQMGTNKISSLQALMAHLWVSITRSRNPNPDEEVSYNVLVGTRQRIRPPLSEHYLGNAIVFGTVKSTAGELLNNGLGWAAWEINKMVASQTEKEVMRVLEDWSKTPKLSKLGTLRVNHAMTGSSPRFNVFGNDFGWGRPIAVRSGPGNKFDGKLTVFPGFEQGSIDFEACLSDLTLQSLADDAEFMEFASN